MTINIDNFYKMDYIPIAVIFRFVIYLMYIQHYVYMYIS